MQISGSENSVCKVCVCVDVGADGAVVRPL